MLKDQHCVSDCQ